jgi:hypothetical protein
MRRPPPVTAIKPSMLKHFLVVTAVLTGCIVMFATGENGQALQEQVQQRQEQNRVLAAQKAQGTVRKVNGLVIAKGTNLSDNSGGGGETASTPVAQTATTYAATPDFPEYADYRKDGSTAASSPIPFGDNTDRAPGRSMDAAPGNPPRSLRKPPPNEIARIVAASRARSGLATGE